MLVTLEWLKEYVEFDLDAAATSHLLTMAGLEVEGTEESEIGPVLSVTVTPNRGDCLSVVGLAREIIAKLGDKCVPTEMWHAYRSGWTIGDEDSEHDCASLASVTIEDYQLCPRYAARLVRGFHVAPSSGRLQKRLVACGMRPISNIVDVTNYVLLELGQPLHAFDHDKLTESRIVVRQACPGDRITTLDSAEREVNPPMLMICDAQRPIAVAGVMGGLDTEVTDGTQNMLLESAYFNPVSVRRTSKALGLRTEASYRFERGVDPVGIVTALNRACDLIEVETGLKPVRGVIDVYPGGPQPRQIDVDLARAARLLGMPVEMGEALGYLTRLGMKVEPQEGNLAVTVPERRGDISREEDLIEEIGRVHGYEHIPDELPFGRTLQGKTGREVAFEVAVRSCLVGLGMTEVVNHTLRAPSPLDPTDQYVGPREPASPELSILRPSLLTGLLGSLQHNVNRGLPDLALFEIGRVFDTTANGCEETKHVSLALCGRKHLPDWQHGEKVEESDFFTLKGLLLTLVESVGAECENAPHADPRFHPGRCAALVDLGVFGELHPDRIHKFDLPKGTLVAELSMDELFRRAKPHFDYKPPSRFPAIRRDIAFEIPKAVPYAQVEAVARETGGELLEEMRLFDVYEGKGIAEGNHSLAIAITFRKPDGTMTDEEANDVRERVWSAIEALGARRR